MNKKFITISLVLIIISFFVGALAYGFLHREGYRDLSFQENQLISLNKSQLDTFRSDLDNYQLTLSRYNVNDELKICNQMIYLYSYFPVIEYNILHRKNSQKIISSILDTVLIVLPSIKKEYLSDNYKTLLLSLSDKKINDNVKLSYLYFVENSLMSNYLSHVYRNSISLSYAELLNITSKDIIKLGETYRSQLVLSIKDVSGNKDLVELLDDTTAKPVEWNGITFVEKPTNRGKYHHDLLLFLSGFYGNRGWRTSVDYDVK